MTRDLGQLSCDGTVHILDDIEVRWKEDIKVSLVNLNLRVSRIQMTQGKSDLQKES